MSHRVYRLWRIAACLWLIGALALAWRGIPAKPPASAPQASNLVPGIPLARHPTSALYGAQEALQ